MTSVSIVIKFPLQRHCSNYGVSLSQVKLVGYKELLKWVALDEKGIVIALPQLTPRQLPCQWGWTLQLTGIN